MLVVKVTVFVNLPILFVSYLTFIWLVSPGKIGSFEYSGTVQPQLPFAFLIINFPEKFGYIFLRIKTFFDPQKGDNFQSQKALDAIKEGGLTGRGMGEGILKDKVPEAHTDYIIAVISEEFGVIFILFIVIIFLFIGYKVLNKVFAEQDEFIKLSLIGLMSLLIIQILIHIGVNIRLLPTTGMTLPFLSYGGSSLIGSSILAGIILNFTRKDTTR